MSISFADWCRGSAAAVTPTNSNRIDALLSERPCVMSTRELYVAAYRERRIQTGVYSTYAPEFAVSVRAYNALRDINRAVTNAASLSEANSDVRDILAIELRVRACRNHNPPRLISSAGKAFFARREVQS